MSVTDILGSFLGSLHLGHQTLEGSPAHPFGLVDWVADSPGSAKPMAELEGAADRPVIGRLALRFVSKLDVGTARRLARLEEAAADQAVEVKISLPSTVANAIAGALPDWSYALDPK